MMRKKNNDFPTRKSVPFIEQMQQTECALCCMAMIVGYYKSHVSLYELRERMGNGRDGTTLFHLKKLGEQLGFESKAYKRTSSELKELSLPAILFWEGNHFVVLEKITSKYFVIVDPGSGRRKINESDFSQRYSGYVLTLSPGKNFKLNPRKSVWSSFSYLIMDRPKIFVIVFCLTFFLQLVGISMPLLIQFVIDKVLVPMDVSLLNVFLVGIIGLVTFHILFTYVRGRVLITLNNQLDYEIQSNFFKHILKLPYQFFLLRSFGDLLFRANSMKIIRDQLANQVIKGFLDSATLVVLLFYMFFQSPLMATIVTAMALTNLILISISQKYLSETNQKEIKQHSEVQGAQTEMLYGIFGIKTSGVENQIYERWFDRFKGLLAAYKKKEIVLNYVNTASSCLQILAPLIVLWIGAYQVFSGNIITIGIIVAFHAVANQFFGISGSMVQTVNSFILATSYLKRVEDVLDAPQEANGKEVKRNLEGNIQLANVDFCYSKYSEKVVDNISLNIKKGQKVAIVGKSGSGKTTLANIIIGLFKPTSGEVYYDGTSIRELDLQHLRQQIGTVPQNVTLFNRSIYENITLHSPNMPLDKVIEVAKVAQIHDEIMRMPMQYHTMISEMGMNISGGQRQRIALAKALIDKPKILVLDEATSSLDHVNEAKIDEYLSKIKCTRVVIAHRLTTVMNSDLIIVVENGKIIASGTHHELLKESSFYNHFYRELIS